MFREQHPNRLYSIALRLMIENAPHQPLEGNNAYPWLSRQDEHTIQQLSYWFQRYRRAFDRLSGKRLIIIVRLSEALPADSIRDLVGFDELNDALLRTIRFRGDLATQEDLRVNTDTSGVELILESFNDQLAYLYLNNIADEPAGQTLQQVILEIVVRKSNQIPAALLILSVDDILQIRTGPFMSRALSFVESWVPIEHVVVTLGCLQATNEWSLFYDLAQLNWELDGRSPYYQLMRWIFRNNTNYEPVSYELWREMCLKSNVIVPNANQFRASLHNTLSKLQLAEGLPQVGNTFNTLLQRTQGYLEGSFVNYLRRMLEACNLKSLILSYRYCHEDPESHILRFFNNLTTNADQLGQWIRIQDESINILSQKQEITVEVKKNYLDFSNNNGIVTIRMDNLARNYTHEVVMSEGVSELPNDPERDVRPQDGIFRAKYQTNPRKITEDTQVTVRFVSQDDRQADIKWIQQCRTELIFQRNVYNRLEEFPALTNHLRAAKRTQLATPLHLRFVRELSDQFCKLMPSVHRRQLITRTIELVGTYRGLSSKLRQLINQIRRHPVRSYSFANNNNLKFCCYDEHVAEVPLQLTCCDRFVDEACYNLRIQQNRGLLQCPSCLQFNDTRPIRLNDNEYHSKLSLAFGL